MSNYFRCPYCGAPNDSTSKCTYCGEIFKKGISLLSSKTDKGLFDLAIYSYRETDYSKAVELFEKIIIKDNDNKIAWFYKCISEFLDSYKPSLDKLIEKIRPYKSLPVFEKEFLLVLHKSLIPDKPSFDSDDNLSLNPYQKINSYNTLELFNLISGLSDTSINEFTDIYAIRHQAFVKRPGFWDNDLFAEINLFLQSSILISSDKNKSEKYLETIKELLLSRYKYLKKQKEDALEYLNEKTNPHISKELLFQVNTLKNTVIREMNESIEIFNFFINNLLKNFENSNLESTEIIEIKLSIEKFLQSKIDANIYPEKKNPESNKTGCFIATATMGSYNHPVVMDLRMFRDNWLLKRKWGVAFTDWYYVYGAKAARVIEKSVVLKRLAYIIIVKPLQLIIKHMK